MDGRRPSGTSLPAKERKKVFKKFDSAWRMKVGQRMVAETSDEVNGS